ncbi:MAG: hypothetical protein ACR2N0_18115 [Rubrobacteraceae bacterium]
MHDDVVQDKTAGAQEDQRDTDEESDSEHGIILSELVASVAFDLSGKRFGRDHGHADQGEPPGDSRDSDPQSLKESTEARKEHEYHPLSYVGLSEAEKPLIDPVENPGNHNQRELSKDRPDRKKVVSPIQGVIHEATFRYAPGRVLRQQGENRVYGPEDDSQDELDRLQDHIAHSAGQPANPTRERFEDTHYSDPLPVM